MNVLLTAQEARPRRILDPAGEYRVLYAASQVLSCYVATLARFRPDYQLKTALAAIRGDDDFQQIGYLSLDWLEQHCPYASANHSSVPFNFLQAPSAHAEQTGALFRAKTFSSVQCDDRGRTSAIWTEED